MAVEFDHPMMRLLVIKGNKLAAPSVERGRAGLAISVSVDRSSTGQLQPWPPCPAGRSLQTRDVTRCPGPVSNILPALLNGSSSQFLRWNQQGSSDSLFQSVSENPRGHMRSILRMTLYYRILFGNPRRRHMVLPSTWVSGC